MTANWRLIDYGIAEDMETDERRTTLIKSEPQLREALDQLAHQSPRIVHLVAPAGDALVIGIGGPFASLSWVKTPVEVNCKIALANHQDTEQPTVFQDRGMEHSIDPDQLFPLSTIIEAVMYFFVHQVFPTWIQWRVWNPVRSRWEE